MHLSLTAVPLPARYFGLAGLLPFVAGAIACWLVPESGTLFGSVTPKFILCAYGAVILSFLGGIRWGLAMQHSHLINDWVVVGLAMVPSLIAWPALLVGPSLGIALVVVGLLLQYAMDVKWNKSGLTPAWFLTLRRVLTAVAVCSLLVGGLAA